MPFPFYPIGAVVAALILGGALTVFVLALKGLDRAATQVGGAVVGGLVSGIRDWSAPRWVQTVSPAGIDPTPSSDGFDPVGSSDAVVVEPVRRSRG